MGLLVFQSPSHEHRACQTDTEPGKQGDIVFSERGMGHQPDPGEYGRIKQGVFDEVADSQYEDGEK